MTEVTQQMVDQLVDKDVQAQIIERYAGIDMDPVRLAWPFKTEEELKKLGKWYKQHKKSVKEKVIKEHVKQYGEALL